MSEFTDPWRMPEAEWLIWWDAASAEQRSAFWEEGRRRRAWEEEYGAAARAAWDRTRERISESLKAAPRCLGLNDGKQLTAHPCGRPASVVFANGYCRWHQYQRGMSE